MLESRESVVATRWLRCAREETLARFRKGHSLRQATRKARPVRQAMTEVTEERPKTENGRS